MTPFPSIQPSAFISNKISPFRPVISDLFACPFPQYVHNNIFIRTCIQILRSNYVDLQRVQLGSGVWLPEVEDKTARFSDNNTLLQRSVWYLSMLFIEKASRAQTNKNLMCYVAAKHF